MARKRKQYSADFKAKVALEAISGRRTLSEIAQEYQLHPTQISKWKQMLQQLAPELFTDGRKKHQPDNQAAELEKLHRIIGEQAVKIDFLKKKSGH